MMTKVRKDTLETYIGPGTVVRGNIEAYGTVRVDGCVHGSIQTEGSVIVGSRAQVYGDIVAAAASIGGFVQGGVYVLGTIETGREGRVRGDLFAARLEAAEGSVFRGRVQVSGSGLQTVSARASFMERTAGDTAPAGMKPSTNPFPGVS